jgi:hypothetical protein
MNRSDDVFFLIKSLTPAEKRSFKITASRHVIGNKNKYEGLFDLYDELPGDEGYDEDLFKKKLVQKGIGKHLAADRQYLKDLILLSLRSARPEPSITDRICEFLENDEIFRNKRLNAMRRKNIQKAKELCLTYDRFPEAIIFLDREYSLMVELNHEEFKEINDVLEAERKKIYTLMEELQVLGSYQRKLFHYRRMMGSLIIKESHTLLEALEKDPVFLAFEYGKSFSHDTTYALIMQHMHIIKGNREEQYFYHRKLISLYEENPTMIEQRRIDFKIAIYNALTAAMSVGKFSDFPELMDKARALPAKDLNEEGEDWQNMAFYDMLLKMNTGGLKEVSDNEASYLQGLKKYARKVNMARHRTMLNNIMISHFLCGRWEKAMDLANEILGQKTEVRQDIVLTAKFLQLILLLELGAIDSFQSYFRNFERYCKQNDTLLEDDYALLKLLKKYPSCSGEKERQELLRAMYDMCDDTKPKKSVLLKGGEISLWLEPKLSNKRLKSA